ncbi:hypothetical protein HHK36_001793 [Tetracentron sinense]|uniref:Glucosidase II beta subunit N-terminal domain-containing protein n=1 Tax=Tetracentron sinense TaxID=13715 RepID=A0A834ZY43_TETSI|nr:hypothetical protein HHK36_001793 [Tetracentron sinense]
MDAHIQNYNGDRSPLHFSRLWFFPYRFSLCFDSTYFTSPWNPPTRFSLSLSLSPPNLDHISVVAEEKNFASEVIKCKDGTKSFTRARLNDGFCDCSDGTDEPGTSACPEGKFYCRNVGSKPQLLFSSRVNDLLCDCCDGSDEYDGSIHCPNTCFKDGNVLNNNDNHNSTKTDMGTIHAKETNSRVNLEDLIQKLKGLKMVVILEVVLISCVMAFRLFYRRARSRRRRYRGRNPSLALSEIVQVVLSMHWLLSLWSPSAICNRLESAGFKFHISLDALASHQLP